MELISKTGDGFVCLFVCLIDLDRLQHVMNCVARITTGTSKFENITLALKTLHWLPVELRVLFQIACLTYKARHGLVPPHLASLLHRYNPSRCLQSFSRDLPTKPTICTKKYGPTFAYTAQTVYNTLPLKIQQVPAIDMFKTWLNMHFFIQAFGP